MSIIKSRSIQNGRSKKVNLKSVTLFMIPTLMCWITPSVALSVSIEVKLGFVPGAEISENLK
jgi:hypothetical protein